INEVGRNRQEFFLNAYGGRYSSEWFFSKVLETVRHAPEVYQEAARILEAGDWLVWELCGGERRCLSAAGFKGVWVDREPKAAGVGAATPGTVPAPGTAGRGYRYPDREFFGALHPLLADVVAEKLSPTLWPLGSRAGGLTAAMARRTGLQPGTA